MEESKLEYKDGQMERGVEVNVGVQNPLPTKLLAAQLR